MRVSLGHVKITKKKRGCDGWKTLKEERKEGRRKGRRGRQEEDYTLPREGSMKKKKGRSWSKDEALWEGGEGEQPPSLGNEASPERFAKEWCTRGLHPLSRAMKKHGRRRGRGRERRVERFCHRIHYRLSAYRVSIDSIGRPPRKFLRLSFFLPLHFFLSLSSFFFFFSFFSARF